VLVTRLIVDDLQWWGLLWLVFGGLGVVLIPLELMGRNARQIISTSPTDIVVRSTTPLGRHWRCKRRERMLAQLLRPDVKDELFAALERSLRRHGYDFEAVNDWRESGR
jgi:hypothetical protein